MTDRVQLHSTQTHHRHILNLSHRRPRRLQYRHQNAAILNWHPAILKSYQQNYCLDALIHANNTLTRNLAYLSPNVMAYCRSTLQ